ncbi:MAG: pilin [Elusimicrobiaceae bacterium]|nr:pilin [Elusimicrobiaceae bacterium]
MQKKGFTLIELLAVVLILSILTAIAVPQYRKSLERSRVAEALQMLPALFDSRDRLMTELGYSFRNVPAGIMPAWTTDITFAKLDVEMKGTSITSHEWETDNFTYYLFPVDEPKRVSATLNRGIYSGTSILYDGEDYTCCNISDTTVCPALNIPLDSGCSN